MRGSYLFKRPLSTIGGLIGTFLGTAVLQKIPQDTFNRIVGILIFGLGVFMFVRAVLGHG